MTQDEIIRMALEAGLEQVVGIDPKSGIQTVKCPPLEPLKRFAALVAAHEREKQAEPCRHRIADARNPVVKSGYVCIDCGALFSAADHFAASVSIAPQPSVTEERQNDI